MVFFNYSTMQMAAKVVYYGPGLCGKTTNLQWIFEHTSTESRGEMVSLATETDRTLFFDLLPIDVGSIAGFSTRIQLYTVPGQVFYNTTRKLVLKGVDGVVFVADSQRPMLQANVESFQNLEENLAEMGLSLDNIPVVLQYNKRDLPAICSFEELDQALNRQNWPAIEASALNGQGVFETLKMISKATLLALKKRLTKSRPESGGAAKRPMPPVTRPPLQPRPAPGRKPPPAPVKPAPAARPGTASQRLSKSVTSDVDAALESIGPSTDLDADLEPPALEEAADSPEAAGPPSNEAGEAPALVAEAPASAVEEVPAAEAPVSAAEEAAPSIEEAAASAIEEEVPAIEEAAPAAASADAAAAANAADVAEKKDVGKPPRASETVPAAPSIRPPARRRVRRKARAGGLNALEELEKLRRQAVDPRSAAAENGKREINRSVRMTLKRADFSRAHRVALTLRIEDADLQVVDEARHLHVDLENASSLEELLLRLNIALNASA